MNPAIHEFLTRDHSRLDALLDRSTPTGGTDGPVDPACYAAFRGGLLRHIGIEEKILLPTVKQLRGGEPHPMARRLKLEHAAIVSLLVPTPTLQIVAALRAVLGPHNAAEEAPGGLYASCADIVGEAVGPLLDRMNAAREPPQLPHNDGPAAFAQIAHTLEAAGITLPNALVPPR